MSGQAGLTRQLRWTKYAILGISAALAAAILGAGCSSGAASDSGLSAKACDEAMMRGWLFAGPQAPRPRTEPLPAGILARFAIFRGRTRPGAMPGGERRLDRELGMNLELASFYPSYVRRLHGLRGERRDYVIPGYARDWPRLPGGCESTTIGREATVERRHRVSELVYCVIAAGGARSVSAVGCEPFAAVDAGLAVFESESVARQPVQSAGG